MMLDLISEWCDRLKRLPLAQQVEELNSARRMMHDAGPFNREPVDCIQWVHTENIQANDYNPNSVAPPEMELLKLSILEDGYTQPIVAWKRELKHEVVDGFHRNRVGRECLEVRQRIRGYLPLAVINSEREERGDRIASTIRHNRARGKHAVAAMSEIVIELKRRNWSDEKISRELGMDQDEILRLCQISGLAELFTDQEFSKSWDVEGSVTEADFAELTDDIATYGDEETSGFRTVNTSDEGRIFHTYDKWECHQAGFYATTKDGMSKAQCEAAMCDLLADIPAFKKALRGVIAKWKHSCEHYLTNAAMNRIAWLGQAAACYACGIPAVYRGGFYLLTSEQQKAANKAALEALNKWLKANDRDPVDMDTAAPDREMEIY
jgi:ParB-like chromosome segregation protein Spo0J